jgi:hypothetical protein
LGASVIGPVLLLVEDPLDAVFESVAEVDSDGFAEPLPLELGADVRLADAVGDAVDCGAAEEPNKCQHCSIPRQADILTIILPYN